MATLRSMRMVGCQPPYLARWNVQQFSNFLERLALFCELVDGLLESAGVAFLVRFLPNLAFANVVQLELHADLLPIKMRETTHQQSFHQLYHSGFQITVG